MALRRRWFIQISALSTFDGRIVVRPYISYFPYQPSFLSNILANKCFFRPTMVLTGKIIPLLVPKELFFDSASGSNAWLHCWFIGGGGDLNIGLLTNPKGTPCGVSKRLQSSGP